MKMRVLDVNVHECRFMTCCRESLTGSCNRLQPDGEGMELKQLYDHWCTKVRVASA